MNYAVLKDNKVINIIVADSQEIAEEATGFNCIEYTDKNPAQIGWDYDGSNFNKPTE
jgi:hypothetical protein